MNQNKQLVMPIKILVQQYNKAFECSYSYNENHVQLFDLLQYKRQRNYCPDIVDTGKVYDDFSEALLIELLSISNEKDAEVFFDNHPRFRLYFDSSLSDSYGLITKDEYLRNVVKEIRAYHEIKDIYNIFADYQADSTNHEKWLSMVFALGTTQAAGRLLDLEELFYCKEFVKCQSEESQFYAELAIKYLMSDLEAYIESQTNLSTCSFSLRDLTIKYECPTLLSAMYLRFFVSVFNQDEYRKCAHPKCNAYFKVNKSHPQSLCEKHIAVRQRKRENAKLKMQREIEEENALIEEMKKQN